MSDQELWLARHGETEWSRDKKHTGCTDLPLTSRGEEAALAIGDRLGGVDFALVLTSPLVRARDTARLAGFPDAHPEQDLVEWGYGSYEGITTEEIRETVPGWTVWTHPSPGGEPAEQVARRLDRVIGKVHAAAGRVLLFGHGHSLRALTARWLGQPVAAGRHYKLDTATISVLGYERETPVIVRWNT